MNYKVLYGEKEFELVPYLESYLKEYPEAAILIGCDSQNEYRKGVSLTTYAIVVALHRPGKGAHVLYKRWRTPMERIRSTRLLNEVWYAVETAEEIRKSGLPKVKWIDIDINPDPKYKSNEVFRQAIGLVEGMGYECRYKTLGPIATYAADHLVKV